MKIKTSIQIRVKTGYVKILTAAQIIPNKRVHWKYFIIYKLITSTVIISKGLIKQKNLRVFVVSPNQNLIFGNVAVRNFCFPVDLIFGNCPPMA